MNFIFLICVFSCHLKQNLKSSMPALNLYSYMVMRPDLWLTTSINASELCAVFSDREQSPIWTFFCLQYGIGLDILCAEKMIMLPKSLFNGIRNEVDAEIVQVKLGCPQSPTTTWNQIRKLD